MTTTARKILVVGNRPVIVQAYSQNNKNITRLFPPITHDEFQQGPDRSKELNAYAHYRRTLESGIVFSVDTLLQSLGQLSKIPRSIPKSFDGRIKGDDLRIPFVYKRGFTLDNDLIKATQDAFTHCTKYRYRYVKILEGSDIVLILLGGRQNKRGVDDVRDVKALD